MATCPFLSYEILNTVSNSSVTYDGIQQVECIGSSCQLWDSTSGTCGLLPNAILRGIETDVETLKTDINGTMKPDLDTIKGYTETIKDDTIIIKENTTEMKTDIDEKIQPHIETIRDDTHNTIMPNTTSIQSNVSNINTVDIETIKTDLAAVKNTASNIRSDTDAMRPDVDRIRQKVDQAGGKPPAMAMLISEAAGSEDCDDNSKIYQKDFIIDPTDEDKPMGLVSLDATILDSEGNPPDGLTIISWNAYLTWALNGTPDPFA